MNNEISSKTAIARLAMERRRKRKSLPNIFSDLFCERIVDIDSFEMGNYVYFLDKVGTVDDLIRGLCELSPFADDALAVAESMTDADFVEFKLSLVNERRASKKGDVSSTLSPRFDSLVIPKRFIPALSLSIQASAPFGTTLYRIWETEHGMRVSRDWNMDGWD